MFDPVNEKLKAISEQLHLPPMKYVVRITVESVWDMGPGPHAGEAGVAGGRPARTGRPGGWGAGDSQAVHRRGG